MKKQSPVAIIGIGGIFPDAPTLDRFWRNIEERRCAAREIPDGRWLIPKVEAFSPQKGAPDKVYSLNACLIEDFRFDPRGLALDPALLSRLDPVFHLALHAAREAFEDAVVKGLDRSRVGVAIGNIALPTDASSALTRELLVPLFEEKVVGRHSDRPVSRTDPLNRYVAGLPAGLISQGLELGGGSFTLDAACASSLYALKLAVEELRSGRADAMITGGVSRPESLYTQMGFSQLRALSARGIPAPFDAAADGLIVGEGAGMFVLKRLDDALAAGDRIYGVIRGIGLSNDVGGSLLAPNTVGQLRAMRSAYKEAGWSPADVDYVECHATGTPTGDPIEVASLRSLWGERGWIAGQCALGSVKSNVGHLLTAAGAAGLMKMLLAFKRKSLPPTANFVKTGPHIELRESPFRVQGESAPWTPRSDKTPRRAAISAFGFGGINAHVLVEEFAERRATGRRRPPPQSRQAGNAVPIGIVGMEARFGPLAGLRDFQEAVLSGRALEPSSPRARWWGLPEAEGFKGHLLSDVGVRSSSFRIPPKEIEEMLPQQLLMLDTAAKAVADARLPEAGRDRMGVFIGIGLDLNTTNFGFRWDMANRAAAWAEDLGTELTVEALRRAAGPALSANRTMGALGGIVASRVAREFGVGGPSFTVSSEETSGLRALEVAVRSLQRGELDSALVGAVDVNGDARAALAAHAGRPYALDGAAKPFDPASEGAAVGEGAAAIIIKRLDDAVRDGDRVYAVVVGIGSASGGPASYQSALRRGYDDARVDPSRVGLLETHGSGTPSEDRAEVAALAEFFGSAATNLRCALGAVKAQIGHAGAASGLAGVVKAALALYQEILPPMTLAAPIPELARAENRFHVPLRPQYWLRDRAEGPRRAGVSAISVDGGSSHAVLEGFDGADEPINQLERRQPLGARSEALFAVEADEPAGLIAGLQFLRGWLASEEPDSNVERLARRWLAKNGCAPARKLGLALVARDWTQLLSLAQTAERSIAENPERPIAGDRIHFTYRTPLGPDGVSFVFPGSGNQYVGMGVELGAQWPEVLRRLDGENGYLKRQLVPEHYAAWRLTRPEGWQDRAESELLLDYKSMIFGSVAHGAAVSDLVRSFGVEPRAVIGYSLGETAGLFALRAWTSRDEMLRRMNESSLFVSDLAGPCDAARQFWNLPTDERVDWVLGVIDRPADAVRRALKGMERAALLIVNAPVECVVGGYRKAVDNLVEGLGCVFLPLQGVSTVHFPAAKLVEQKYRDLHLQPTSAPAGVRFYSGALGKAYEVTRESAADSITAQAVKGFDFSALIKQAYEDGARVFVELGPQASCARMIAKILGPLPHGAKSACVRHQDQASTILRLLAFLIAERVPVDLRVLYGQPTLCAGHREAPPPENDVRAALGGKPFERLYFKPKAAMPPTLPSSVTPSPPPPSLKPILPTPNLPVSRPAPAAGAVRPAPAGLAVLDLARAVSTSLLQTDQARVKAHDAFLRISENFAAFQAKNLAFQNWLISQASSSGGLPAQTISPKVFMDREACLEFAVGSIGKVLGEKFAHVDAHPTRVRLPAEPLMLVDRILSVEGEPNSMKSGRVVTEHDALPDAWYLDCGKVPTCVAVEAGQADLFLSGYLGIDSQTKGLAVYRLLDAQIEFHQGLPDPGDVIHYDIRIKNFAQHEDTWLFFFEYDSTVNGRPLLTMRKGCAGFFTQEELAAGKGIVFTEEETKPAIGKKPADWRELAPLSGVELYDDRRLESLRRGDLAGAFGPSFSGLKVKEPSTLPGGRMKLVDRILELDPRGGRYGLGQIRGEADIHPDDWHLVCHFSDDNVMPGTLMFECCLHTLRVLLLRLGWVGEKDAVWYEPVPGVKSQLKCRGQVLASTKKVVYEISVKELGYGPEPYAIADALMYSDGKPIVLISDMSLRIGGLTRSSLEALWDRSPKAKRKPLFDTDRITAFAIGKPSEAFGEPYKVFDSERVIARLPGPPYQFLDRIVDIKGCGPFMLAAGGEIVAEYDVPPGEWYFKSNGQPTMPFAVLLEIGLQPCGWLASYLGSALTSPIDLSYRNLGGTATQFMDVGPDIGTLVTKVKLTKVSKSGGMIIQNNDFEISCAMGLVYRGRTEFGYFTKEALGQQIGVRGAKVFEPSVPGRMLKLGDLRGMPDEKLLMLDSVEFDPKGGPTGLGYLRGLRKVDPKEWFFAAHFYQDPVCPGSLGLESFIQLMKVYARQLWPATVRFESMALGQEHTWLYRGQYTPVNKQVEVSCVITAVDEAKRLIKADGFLKADGLTIYRMKDFSLRLGAFLDDQHVWPKSKNEKPKS